MNEIERLLYECEGRMEVISDLIKKHMNEDEGKALVSELYLSAKSMNDLKDKAKSQMTALDNCKDEFSEASEPWNFDPDEAFRNVMDKVKAKKKKKKNEHDFNEELQKRWNTQESDMMEVEEEVVEAIDPWTRTTILHPMQSTTCKHLYDKKSINCIIKNRPQFKCPYIGCQNVVTKDTLIDLRASE